ncbi:fumarylacetoacetate hydrolase family protein [Roseivivax marinus]|uniref:fumarylacetoacetate hydrolase family protein n=1 Tax=Roseivivax marinus TaxID=1379903 RepID=UPI001F033D29|nr:fumarylacetoacetate hydrolase family protein [Roseivivax marinus]UMA66502.1 fumarylacetoacetate hydrolase family protein [Roseivivax marinus]
MDTFFEPRPQPALAVAGAARLYPVGRIFCIGRNYAAHAAEMGNEVDRERPFFFTKSSHHLAASGALLPYPQGTEDLHHEVELVVALGSELRDAGPEDAAAAVFGYGVGLDLTRRDLQARAKDRRHPWDAAKDVEGSAVIGSLTRAEDAGSLEGASIRLEVNGEVRQYGALADMIWSVPELLAYLSTLYTLAPGDLVMTGTPSGVGPLTTGDVAVGTVDGLSTVQVTVSG